MPDGICSAHLCVYAEGRVHLWCNGIYIVRGPLLHHPNHRSLQKVSLTEFLRAGRNVIAIAAHTPGVSLHNCVLSREPGPVGQLGVVFDRHPYFELATDDSWRCTGETGWLTPVPRRNWALGAFEILDAALAPFGWQEPGFDDTAFPD